ncbi:5,6-dimethylbenzimidazole synthase [Calidifontibacter terrae]
MSDRLPPRPTPLIGDPSSARERAADPAGWAMPPEVVKALESVIGGRRDIRRFRADSVPDELVQKVLAAAHAAPSVGHSQPWRFIVVRDPATRDRAAHMADRARLQQAHLLTDERAARLLDLKLEGVREAPVGVVVTCDRRAPSAGVLGRATFPDTDLWSCACAIQNLWLTARALGLGVGWVTLFDQAELGELLGLPEGVVTLGWLCLGWPDERPPSPGLERAAWSRKLPLDQVVMSEGWADVASPASHLRGPAADRLVGATDDADRLLSPPDALGVLDRAVNRVASLAEIDGATLLLVGADHPVVRHGVSAYDPRVTRDVLTSAVAGTSAGVAHARAAGFETVVVDAGVAGEPVEGAVDARPLDPRGDLLERDALTVADVDRLLARGRSLAGDGLLILGEVGVGNTTVAAALAAALLGLSPAEAVGLGSGADAAMVERKVEVVAAAIERVGDRDVRDLLAALGGPEIVLLAGVVLGAAEAGQPVVLDGLATSVAALVAVRLEPASQAYLIAGQRSREEAHGALLRELGVEPLLDLRLRAGEGIGGCLAASLLLQGLRARRATVRTSD